MLSPEQQQRRDSHARAMSDINRMTDPHAALKRVHELFSVDSGLQYFHCVTATTDAESLEYQRRVVMDVFERLRYIRFSETSHTMMFDNDMPVYMQKYVRMLRDEIGVPYAQIRRPYHGRSSALKGFGLSTQHWNMNWWCDGDDPMFAMPEALLDHMCGKSAREGRTWMQAAIPMVLSINYSENLRKRANLTIGMCRLRIYSNTQTRIQIQTNNRAKLFNAKLVIELPLDTNDAMPDSHSPETAFCGYVYQDFNRPGKVAEMRMRCDSGALYFP